MTAPSINRSAQHRRPSPWARWLYFLFLPIGIGAPVITYVLAMALVAAELTQ
jgi:hypothetical protein